MRKVKRLALLPVAALFVLCMMGASWADSAPPTVSARTSGTTLYITATDDNSGIATVRINGLNLPNATEGEMEVGLAGYTTTKTLSIQAIDNAGNNSSTITLENSCYGMDLSMQETAAVESTDTAKESEPATTTNTAQATEASAATVVTTTTTQAVATTNDSPTAATVEPSTAAAPTADVAEESAEEPASNDSDDTEVTEDTDEEEVTDELTPGGNLTLVDDVVEEDTETLEDLLSGKQFLTVSTRNGNYFYLIIDRDGETENVYFLNQVDESDLLALIEDGTEEESIEESDEGETEETPVCTCTTRCEAGQVNTACVVCSMDLDDCEGEEPEEKEEETEIAEEPVEAEDTSSGRGGIFIVIVLLALLGGGVAAYFKFFRQPPVSNALDPDDWEDDEDTSAEVAAEDSVEHEVIDL